MLNTHKALTLVGRKILKHTISKSIEPEIIEDVLDIVTIGNLQGSAYCYTYYRPKVSLFNN